MECKVSVVRDAATLIHLNRERLLINSTVHDNGVEPLPGFTDMNAAEVHGAKNHEVHDVQTNARQGCERARDGERPVS